MNYHRIKHKIGVIIRCIKGEILKRLLKFGVLRPNQSPLNKTERRKKKLIVSLTSYGRRVSAVAPYAIMSMMRQTYKPDKIILWLDDDNWSDNNLPDTIQALVNYGLSVRYCKDIKSYKKLIPALIEYPNDLIFTIDDDLYYPSGLLETVMDAYKVNPDEIICVRGYSIGFSESGSLLPYNEWEQITYEDKGLHILPTGGAGCLYQKRLLFKDITNECLFLNLSPHADDIWFYFMEYLSESKIHILSISKEDAKSIDSFYQHFHSNSNLAKSNCGNNQNDVQIKQIMSYYGLSEYRFASFIKQRSK